MLQVLAAITKLDLAKYLYWFLEFTNQSATYDD